MVDRSERRAFIFVHGFNNSFEDAARRTAQIAFDVKFDGVPLFYSWPSKGKALDYVYDTNNADQASPISNASCATSQKAIPSTR